jgi:hypothetical protein
VRLLSVATASSHPSAAPNDAPARSSKIGRTAERAGETAAGQRIGSRSIPACQSCRPASASASATDSLGAERRRQIREGHSNGGTNRQRLESDS